jgi:hypothetical protein
LCATYTAHFSENTGVNGSTCDYTTSCKPTIHELMYVVFAGRFSSVPPTDGSNGTGKL